MQDLINYMEPMWQEWPFAFMRLVLLACFVMIFWRVLNAITKFDDEAELVVSRNWAFLAQRMGIVSAFIIGSWPAVVRDRGEDHFIDYVWQGAETLWVLVALLAASVVVDRVVLAQVHNTTAIRDGNLALGLTEAGFYVGLGFILSGSLTGSSSTWQQGLASTVVFGILGLAVMVAVYWLHELITPWHLRDNIRDGNVTAALEVAGILAALGVVVRIGVAGDFTGWRDGFVAFTATVIVAVFTLYLFRWFIDRALLLTTSIREIQANNQTVAQAFMSGTLFTVSFTVATIVSTKL